jgi:hypothetical protein
MKHVDKLVGSEGGRWRVWTQGSYYDFDLEAGTVTGFPGPTSGGTVDGTTRPIRKIIRCRIGEGGYWTMDAGGLMDRADFHWQATTIIRSFERMNDTNDSPGATGFREPV